MGPTPVRICEISGYVKQYIFNGVENDFHLMHTQNVMNLIKVEFG